jgi:ribonuclease HII
MVLCGICFKESDLKFLVEIGVKDSKKLSAKKRYELSKLITANCKSCQIVIVSPQEIDEREINKISLNELEALKMAQIINILKPDIIYLDAVDVNENRFKTTIEGLLHYKPNNIISKHKADDLYPIVSAASIVAKDKRDMIIEEMRNKYGNFGSGYPSDKKTIDFLREWVRKNKNTPDFVRKSWETTKNLLKEELTNKKITDFIK